ncbi:MAG: SGNH/GDSL hydrolase family protein [Clostridium sp.]|nr:SGNH/GDSL hydrolase family protein [Clostridium sp.]
MGKVNRFLLMLIAMAAIMLAAVGIDKGIQHYNARKWEAERVARYEQAHADVADIEMTISQISNDPEALNAFIEENKAYFDEMLEEMENGGGEGQGQGGFSHGTEGMGGENGEFYGEDAEQGLFSVSGDDMEKISENWDGDTSENRLGDVSGNWFRSESGKWFRDVSGNLFDVSGNHVDVSGNRIDVSGNRIDVSGNRIDVSGNLFDAFGNQIFVLENGVFGETMSESGASGDNAFGAVTPEGTLSGGFSGTTLLEKRKVRGSYIETRMQNGVDKKIITENSLDFSNISIACLGDSITEAANLSDMEDYQQYAYPAKLCELLGAKKVTNLGIGGSSIGRYWDKAFVDRYKDIPEDTDLILVMGGTNDGFCLSEEELGTMEERAERTYIGDLDELMRSLKEDYPDAVIIFATPLPNVLHDLLRKERDYLLPQSVLVNIMKELAAEYEIPVIDLYNSNILDTHDAAVIYNYMPDGVHCNSDGYTLLAEHLAAEVIRLYGEEAEKKEAGALYEEEAAKREAGDEDGQKL